MSKRLSQMEGYPIRYPEVAVATIDLSPVAVNETIRYMEGQFKLGVDRLDEQMGNIPGLKESLEAEGDGKTGQGGDYVFMRQK